MKKYAAAVLIALLSAASIAQGLVTDSPIRFPSGSLVKVGDSEGQVLATAGRAPDREVTLESSFGGAVGQRWIYIEPGYSGRIVTIEFYGGRVGKLWSERLK